MRAPVVFGKAPLRAAGDVDALCVSPDGRLLAVGSGSGDEASLWRLPERTLVARLAEPANSFAFAPGHDILFLAYAFTQRWDFDAGIAEPFGFTHDVGGPIALSPDGSLLAGSRPPGDRQEVVLIETGSEALRWAKPIRGSLVTGIAFVDGGRMVLVGETEGARLLDTRTGETIAHREPPAGGRQALVAVSPVVGTLALGRAGGSSLALFEGGQSSRRIVALPFELEHLAFSQDGLSIALLGSGGRTAVLSAVELREVPLERPASGGAVAALAGSLLAVSHHRSVTLFDLAAGAQVAEDPAHRDQVTAIAVAPDGEWIATAGGFDRTVHLWRTRDGEHVRALGGHGGRVQALAIAPDGARLATGCADGILRIFDPGAGGAPAVELDEDDASGEIAALAHLGDRELVTIGEEGAVVLRDARTGEPLRTLMRVGARLFTGTDPGLAVSSHHGWIAASGSQGQVTVVERGTGAVVFVRPEGFGRVLALAPSQPWLAIREESSVSVWQLPEGTLVGRIGVLASAACFDHDGRLALARFGGPPLVVDVSSGREALTPGGVTGEATAIAFAPDGRLAIGFQDGSAMLVALPAPRRSAAAQQALARAARADAARMLLASLAARSARGGYRDAPSTVRLEAGGLGAVVERADGLARLTLSVPDASTTLLRLAIDAPGAFTPPREAETATVASHVGRWIRRRLGLGTQRDDRGAEPWLATMTAAGAVRSARAERTAGGLEVTLELEDLPTIEVLLEWAATCAARRAG